MDREQMDEVVEVIDDVIDETTAKAKQDKKPRTKKVTREVHEPQRYVELERDIRIFQKKLSPAEQRDHAVRVYELECEMESAADKAKKVKAFIDNHLTGEEPVRKRAREDERKRRAALESVEKKRAELLREYHLNAAADGYVWIDVECAHIADDVECTISIERLDTHEIILDRPMNEFELKRREKRMQLTIDDVA
jgi:hypothetical protein